MVDPKVQAAAEVSWLAMFQCFAGASWLLFCFFCYFGTPAGAVSGLMPLLATLLGQGMGGQHPRPPPATMPTGAVPTPGPVLHELSDDSDDSKGKGKGQAKGDGKDKGKDSES